MGGSGGGIAYNREEFNELIAHGLDLSPVGQVLIEESVIGWKEYELEVMRDKADNVVIVCSIENLDPMGVHTGDSITVAPAQTLTDKEYQRMRDAALAHHPRDRRRDRRQQHPVRRQPRQRPDDGHRDEPARQSRSSALASKATGFPIAKIAAKLAVGYRLDELRNDITRETPACFEPTIDYVVTKVPRWAFEKFPDADPTLTTQMKSVGETMAIGRTFKESLQKALRGLETGRFGIGCDRADRWGTPRQPTMDEIAARLATPTTERIWFIRYALKAGLSVDDVFQRTKIDRWFLNNIRELIEVEDRLAEAGNAGWEAPANRERTRALLLEAKQNGFSDRQLCNLWHTTEKEIRRVRKELGVVPSYKRVDTCAAEFEAYTPYYYSTYEAPVYHFTAENAESAEKSNALSSSAVSAFSAVNFDDETVPPSGKDRIMILGGGPNRIGQGIEFDYCCCQAAFALSEAGYETIMVNSNPETVSTDYDTSDHLFFEPLTAEDVLNICDRMKPAGLIVQFGGQTPLNLATGAGRRRGADHRHQRGQHRGGRGPSALSGVGQSPGAETAGQRHGARAATGRPRRPPHRLPGAGAAELRAGRPRHGDRLRRGRPEPLRRKGHRGHGRQTAADRQVPGVGRRGGRRLPQRRPAHGDRRRHAAHRGGGHPLRRLGLRHPAAQFAAGRRRRRSAGRRASWPAS